MNEAAFSQVLLVKFKVAMIIVKAAGISSIPPGLVGNGAFKVEFALYTVNMVIMKWTSAVNMIIIN
ncbi:hypothetical protein QQP08_014364 [Theobroma cacao]|nr:hypothetical protein QQP08_014364 [Theobroma cacao]